MGAEPGPVGRPPPPGSVSSPLQSGPPLCERQAQGKDADGPGPVSWRSCPLTLPLTKELNRSSSAQQSMQRQPTGGRQRGASGPCFLSSRVTWWLHVYLFHSNLQTLSRASLTGLCVSRSDWEGGVGWF